MSAKTPADKLQKVNAWPMRPFTAVMRSEHGKLCFTVLARTLEDARRLMRQPEQEQMGQYPTDWHSRFSHVTIEEQS